MTPQHWWQKAVFYQIYPRSFLDGNGDGIGDFSGIYQKLDYLQDLGIDAIWLSPHYPSPQFDCGYDISDFTAVGPEYGSLNDFQKFIKEAHIRGIRVILDLVLNHTSDHHPWFLNSRSSRLSPYRDWYIWKDGINGNPPNNWNSTFDGLAWEWDNITQQYYYHYFFKQQPDLNWRNPAVKSAMWQAVRYWLDLGVDGFRLDAIGTIYEHIDFPHHSLDLSLAEIRKMGRLAKTPQEIELVNTLWKQMFTYQVEQPGIHEIMQELRSLVDKYGDIVLVGENDDIAFHGNGDNELHMVFNFPLMRTERLTPAWIRQNQNERLVGLAKVSPYAWPCNTLGNHDSPRVFNNYSDKIHNLEYARLSLALMLTLRGTPFLYNGEEIGMSDLMLQDITQYRDLLGRWQYQVEVEQYGTDPAQALDIAAALTRDKNRTPMQWNRSENAGFCPPGSIPWLPVHPNYLEGVNVADQQGNPDSILNFYRKLIDFRKKTPALIHGSYTALHPESDDYFVFLRETVKEKYLVILNMSDKNHRIALNLPEKNCLERFSTHRFTNPVDDLCNLHIHPFEVYIAEIIHSD